MAQASTTDAANCKNIRFEGNRYTLCELDPTKTRLFLNDQQGQTWSHFSALDAALHARNQRLAFGMNAGMYHRDRSPVGLYIEGGKQFSPLITRDGPGNFGLLPNGVFCLTQGVPSIVESRQFKRMNLRCDYATQSGPMLVIDGALHPKFLENSGSIYIRNGIGVTQDGKLLAAISNNRVNFHSFGRLFRDGLKTPNALYLDGNISRLYAPSLPRRDFGARMGPILGVVVPKDN